MDIEKIELQNNILPKELIFAIFQIKSPFFDEYGKNIDLSDLSLVLNTNQENYQCRTDQFKTIFRELGKINEKRKENEKINFLVFPEYSFPPEFIDEAKKFVNQNQIIIIGNYYNRIEKASTSFVLIPEGWSTNTLYQAHKNSISKYEKDFLVSPTEEKILKIIWKPNLDSDYSYIQILTCKDFLCYTGFAGREENKGIIDNTKSGIILVPMCTPKIEPFINEALSLLRECPGKSCNNVNITSILCNCTDLDKNQHEPGIVGGTRIISLIDENFSEVNDNTSVIERGTEGLLLAKINPSCNYSRLSLYTKDPNAVQLFTYKIRFDRDFNFVLEYPKVHNKVFINPHIFYSELGIKKIYAFLVMNDYANFYNCSKLMPKEFLDSSIGVNGIWGYHDILIESYEHNLELVKENINIRLWPLISNDNFNNKKMIGIVYVKQPIKFRDIPIDSKLEEGIQEYIRDNCPVESDPKLKKFLRSIAVGRNYNINQIDEDIIRCQEQHICIYSKCDLSDRTDEEIREKIPEFLVLIQVQKINEIFTETEEELFEQELLKKLILDGRIRTIEQLGYLGGALLKAQYLIHIVSDMEGLKDVVLNIIINHKSKTIRCKTQLILTHQKILENNLPILSEKQIPDQKEKKLNNLIFKYIDLLNRRGRSYFDVLTLKRIEISDAMLLKRTNDVYIDLNELYENEFPQGKDAVLDYIFHLSQLLEKFSSNSVSEKDIKKFREGTKIFFADLGQKVETNIRDQFNEMLTMVTISPKQICEIINIAAVAKAPNFSRPIEYPKIQSGTTIRPLILLNELMADSKGFKKFQDECLKRNPNFTQDKIKENYKIATRINEISQDYVKKLSKHDQSVLNDYTAIFIGLRNFASHPYDPNDTSNFDKKNIPHIPKIVFEVCKHNLTVRSQLLHTI